MPYVPEQKDETRQRIVESARRLFNRNGFAEVTIDQIMADAGLTRGGFYKHFAAKDDLYAEAVRQFGNNPMSERWQRLHVDPGARGRELGGMIINAYLSRDHLDDRDGSCPMIGLPSDVARGSAVTKQAFSQVLKMMVEAFAAGLDGEPDEIRARALAMASACVGSMVLARAVDDAALADELRESVRLQLFETAGWSLGD